MLKLLLATSTGFTVSGIVPVLAEVDSTNLLLLVSSIITALFGGIVLVITTRSNTKINEMKVQAELEKVKRDGEVRVQQVQLDAQRALSAVNAATLASLHTSVVAGAAESVKQSVAMDQTKQRVDHLEHVGPTEVKVVNEAPIPVLPVIEPPTVKL